MAYTEKNLTRGTIRITDPETGLSETGSKSDRANMRERLAAKIRNRGTITSDTKLGAKPKPYTTAKKTEPKKESTSLKRPSFMSKRRWDKIPVSQRRKVLANIEKREGVQKKKKGVGGGAVMPVKGYAKGDSEQSLKQIINEGVQEFKRPKGEKGQPSGEAIEGVKEPVNIPERYESKIPEVVKKAEKKGTMFGDGFMGPEEGVQQYSKREDPSPFVGPDKELEQKPVSEKQLAELDAIDKKLKREEGERGQIEYGRKTYDQQEAPQDTSGLMKLLEDPKEIKKVKDAGEISEEPVKYDVNGYPIYAKGSKKAAEWNAAYAAAEIGKFMWDGREYVKKGKPEEDEKAAVETSPVREDYSTGDANILEESFRAPEQAQPIAQAEPGEFPQSEGVAKHGPEWLPDISKKIKKISERTSDYESRHREIQKLVKPLSKEDTADTKEKAGRWYVDPWTGFAIDLNKLQARQDRKDSMAFAAILPPDQRAAYLSMEGLIEPEDLEKLLEPSELEQLQLQQAKIAVDVASFSLVTAQLKRKDYRTPEQIAAADLKKTTATEGRAVAEKIAAEERGEAKTIRTEERAEDTAIKKFEREKTTPSTKAEMDRYAGLYKNAITNDDFAGQVLWGQMMGFPPKAMQKIANMRKAWEIKQEKKDGKTAFKEIFEFDYDKVVNSRSKLLMGTASLWTTGDIDFQMGGKQVKSREGLLNTLGIEDFTDMRNMAETNPEEAIRMISGLSDLAIFKNRDYQDENGNPDWLSILEDEDVYKGFVLNNAIYKGMNTIYGGEYADIRAYEAKRRKKRYDKEAGLRSITTNQN